ncbi:MAG: hypothetical protein JXA14_14850 [Anaerolineae bacterium]|nr:hypothetical protein [Anaerolineae bacterium]
MPILLDLAMRGKKERLHPSEYHRYGAADGDIEFWGLDQPGAPPPEVAGWVIGDMMDEMDTAGDGLIDDPFDDPFF